MTFNLPFNLLLGIKSDPELQEKLHEASGSGGSYLGGELYHEPRAVQFTMILHCTRT